MNMDQAADSGQNSQPAGEIAERFVNRKQALNWLQAQGYRVSQGKFYGDCKAGFPGLHRDGSLSKYQVLQYGQQLDLEARGTVGERIDSSEHEARKLKAEAEIAEMKAERMRRDEDRLWLHADEAWAQVAALVGTLRDAIRHHLYAGQREIVQAAGGGQDRSQEAYECVDRLVSAAYNEVAGEAIDVKFAREEE